MNWISENAKYFFLKMQCKYDPNDIDLEIKTIEYEAALKMGLMKTSINFIIQMRE